MAQRKAEKTAERVSIENSFARVATRQLEHWQDDKSLRHVEKTRRRLKANILPCLGACKLMRLRPQMLSPWSGRLRRVERGTFYERLCKTWP